MRRFRLFLFTVLLVAIFAMQARAEIGASGYSGTTYGEQQVFTYAYNNSGASITSNSIVILDTTATGGTTLGAYVTTTTTTDSPYVYGVTDETIASATTGRICIRGPHKVWINSTDTAAGDTIGTISTAGKGETTTATTNKAGQVGIALKQSTDTGDGSDIWWCWIRPTQQ